MFKTSVVAEDGQQSLLEEIVRGAPLPGLLADVEHWLEQHIDGVSCKVLLSTTTPDGPQCRPILSEQHERLGTFAISYREPRQPAPDELLRIADATLLARLAILRHQGLPASREHEEKAQEEQRLRALGSITAGIAHDFNNILTAARGHTDLALLKTRNPVVRNSLDEVRKACLRASTLVRQIMSYGQTRTQEREAVGLRFVVDEAIGLIGPSLPPNVTLQTRFSPGPHRVWADASQAHQVIMNVVTNAVQAMDQRAGRVELSLESFEVMPAEQSRDLAHGPYVRLRITDQGCGMSRDTLARAFDPFFTTKAAGVGTGLGLAVVQRIMKSHDGAVTIESKPGEGTTFELYFPAVAELSPRAPGASVTPTTRPERVLYVDDDEAVAFMGVRLLRRLGYQATGLSDSTAALAVFRSNPNAFDIVVADVGMPKIGGPDLVRELKRLSPRLRTLLVSGYVDDLPTPLTSDGQEIKRKPRTLEELSALMQGVSPPPASWASHD